MLFTWYVAAEAVTAHAIAANAASKGRRIKRLSTRERRKVHIAALSTPQPDCVLN